MDDIEPLAIRSAWGLVLRTSLEVLPLFARRCADQGLTPTQGTALLRLGHGPFIMRELAESMACDPSTVTGIVDRLEARALVARGSAPGDRRVTVLTITADGVAVREHLLHALAAPPGMVAALRPEEQEQLVHALALLHPAPCRTFPVPVRAAVSGVGASGRLRPAGRAPARRRQAA